MSGLVSLLRRYHAQLAALLTYLVIYLALFGLLENIVVPVHIIHCPLDNLIPFCKWAILPYCFWFVWVPLVTLKVMARDTKAFRMLYWDMVLGCAAALIIFTLFPNGLHLRQPVQGTDFLSQCVKLLYRTDTPSNVCPSLHVYQTLCVLLAVFRCPSLRSWRTFGIIASILICCSTVLLDQHSVIDVVVAAVLFGMIDHLIVRCFRLQTCPARSRPTLLMGRF